ncbi:hypothetical protein DFH06DRAFT_1176534 [Mycena polygramma]|nr:hypothetical protein DFH06DRAFT_1176534 [Mycena polygramma]
MQQSAVFKLSSDYGIGLTGCCSLSQSLGAATAAQVPRTPSARCWPAFELVFYDTTVALRVRAARVSAFRRYLASDRGIRRLYTPSGFGENIYPVTTTAMPALAQAGRSQTSRKARLSARCTRAVGTPDARAEYLGVTGKRAAFPCLYRATQLVATRFVCCKTADFTTASSASKTRDLI